MTTPVVLESLDLAALLCSRVCHDLISPVGAVVNGMEVLEETNDESTRVFALDLIKKSANQASARLQFCRLAFGAAGSAGAEIDLGDAETVARGFIQDEKVTLAWTLPRELMPKNRVKLLLNLLLLATQIIPRGGTVTAERVGSGPNAGFRVSARGLNARIQQMVPTLVSGELTGPVDAHAIQPFYAGLLARACNLAISFETKDDQIVVSALPVQASAERAAEEVQPGTAEAAIATVV
jgi:histidine phosphotransferase ChpT